MTTSESTAPPAHPPVHVAPSPHLSATSITTQGMMLDVLIALAPAMLVSVFVFQWYAVQQIGLCVLSCLGAEALFTWMRGKELTLTDLSATVTGVILGMSLPWSAPWYVAVIGSFIAIGLGKVVFGGLGFNIFNPAMVGRAFVMLSFAKALGAGAYVMDQSHLAALTQATPLTAAKQLAAALAAGGTGEAIPQLNFLPLFLGNVNGSLGETSALAVLIGGAYLCVKRSAAWEIPVSVVVSVIVFAGLANVLELTPLTAWQQVLGGSLMFGAFFIATDPVSSPLTFTGKIVFGAGVGFIVVVLRVFSSYPEGVMFAVLLMNALVPLINRWTIPKPFGGLPPAKA